MTDDFKIGAKLTDLVGRIVESYQSDDRTHRIDRRFLPSRTRLIQLIEKLLELVYPGYFGRQSLTSHNVGYHVGELIPQIADILHEQLHLALRYQAELQGGASPDDALLDEKAGELSVRFIERIPAIREVLAGDVQAAYDGDPAAINVDEVILAYPGVLAVTVHRLAHELFKMDVPLIPRIMSEWAHLQTGVDIHPGATIGRSFFIDHATGVVIGETTHIGDNVKLYQGVTLGALSFPKDERGRLLRGYQRHPTVLDGVTIYANAIVLGGETTIGRNAVVGGSAFLTSSIPEDCTVAINPPVLRIKDSRSLTDHAPAPAGNYQI